MTHHFYTPTPALQPDVNCFCVIEVTQDQFNKRLYLPDPYPGLVINCGAPLVLIDDDGTETELPRIFLQGLQTRTLNIQATGDFRCIGVSLAIWASRFIVDKDTDLGTPYIALGSKWPHLANALQLMLDQGCEAEAIAALEQLVLDLRSQHHLDVAPVRTAVELLCATNGQVGINELAERCHLSRSQLERRFNYLTGVSPKTMSRLIRFYAICRNMAWDSVHRLTDLAHNFGYVDQSHFIHEFQAMAGRAPREYIADQQRYAADVDYVCRNMAWDSSHRLTDLAHNFGYVDQAHFIHDFQAMAGRAPREFMAYRQKFAADADFLQFSTL